MRRLVAKVTMPPDGSPESVAAGNWVNQFLSWLQVTPPGVTVVVTEHVPVAISPDFVRVDEVVGYFEERQDRRARYHGRAVFFWLITRFNRVVSVHCTECDLHMGACRCESRGEYFGPHWRYEMGDLYPETDKAQHLWAISRASLRAFNLEELDRTPDASVQRRENLLLFLGHLRSQPST